MIVSFVQQYLTVTILHFPWIALKVEGGIRCVCVCVLLLASCHRYSIVVNITLHTGVTVVDWRVNGFHWQPLSIHCRQQGSVMSQ